MTARFRQSHGGSSYCTFNAVPGMSRAAVTDSSGVRAVHGAGPAAEVTFASPAFSQPFRHLTTPKRDSCVA